MAIAALLLTLVAMFARNLIILGLFSPAAVLSVAGPVLAMTAVTLIFVRRARMGTDATTSEIHLESPVSLKRVLSFGGLSLLIQVVSTNTNRFYENTFYLCDNHASLTIKSR